MIVRPFLAVMVALVAFSLQGHFNCRDSAVCEAAVTRNEAMQ